MRKLSWLPIVILLFVSSLCQAQYTTVTATVVDSASTVWANAPYSFSFQPGPNQSNPAGYTYNGAALDAAHMSGSGAANGSGVISISVYQNTLLSPVPSSYNLTVCPNASSKCSTVNFSTSSGSVDLSAQINAAITAPRFQANGNVYGYTDAEAILQLKPGNSYWNVTSSATRTWDGTKWVTNGGTGGPFLPLAGGTLTGALGITAITDKNGIGAVGSNITPWDSTFETAAQLCSPSSCNGPAYGWSAVFGSGVSISQDSTAYDGSYSMAVQRTDLVGNGGVEYPLGPPPINTLTGWGYPTITLIPGRTYTLSGYYLTSGGTSGFTNLITINASGPTVCTNSAPNVCTSQSLPASSTWAFFSISIVAPSTTTAATNYVSLAQGVSATGETVYFDDVVFTDGVATPANSLPATYSGFQPKTYTATGTLAFTGESLMAGYCPSGCTPRWTDSITLSGYNVINDAEGGNTTALTVGTAWTLIDPQFSINAPQNIVAVWSAVNSLEASVAPADIYKQTEQFCRERHRLGWKCLVYTIESIYGLDSERDAVNQWIYQNWWRTGFIDGVIDIAANPFIGADGAATLAGNTYFSPGGVHMTAAGYALVESITQIGLNYFVANGPSFQKTSTGRLVVGSSSLGDAAQAYVHDQNLQVYYDFANDWIDFQGWDLLESAYAPIKFNRRGGISYFGPDGINLNGGTKTIYRCNGGTNDGAIVASPSTQATACTTGSGTLVSITLTAP